MLGTFLLPITSLNFCSITLFTFLGEPTFTKNLSFFAGMGGFFLASLDSNINFCLAFNASFAFASDELD